MGIRDFDFAKVAEFTGSVSWFPLPQYLQSTNFELFYSIDRQVFLDVCGGMDSFEVQKEIVFPDCCGSHWAEGTVDRNIIGARCSSARSAGRLERNLDNIPIHTL